MTKLAPLDVTRNRSGGPVRIRSGGLVRIRSGGLVTGTAGVAGAGGSSAKSRRDRSKIRKLCVSQIGIVEQRQQTIELVNRCGIVVVE
jgi:hypothetical protein